MNPFVGSIVVLGSLGGLFAIVRYMRARDLLSAEHSRKVVHVGMGVVCLSFPWLFVSIVPVLALASMASAALLAVRVIPVLCDRFGCVISGVERRSYGEFAFIAGVAAAFVLSAGDATAYIASVSVLTVADTLAALVGKRLGTHRFATLDGSKSYEGSFAFLVTAIICIAMPLYVFGQPGALLIGVAGGVALMLVEAAIGLGLDNFAIPVACTILIRLLAGTLAAGAM